MQSLEMIRKMSLEAMRKLDAMRDAAKRNAKRKPHVIKYIGTKAKKFTCGLRFKSMKERCKRQDTP